MNEIQGGMRMKSAFAVEAKGEIEFLPEIKELILKETNIAFQKDNMFIYLRADDADYAKEILTAAELFEELHQVILTNNGIAGPYFEDFGIQLLDDCYCLFKADLLYFSFTAGNPNDIQMAKYQVEEHLVFETIHNETTLFFSETHNKELIQNIAKAYKTVLSFTIDK